MPEAEKPMKKIFYYVPVARQPSAIMVASFERARAIAQNEKVAAFAIASWDTMSLSVEVKRNMAATAFLREKEAELLMMVDDDMDFRQDPRAIVRLVQEMDKTGADIIAPLMVRRSPPHYVAYNKVRFEPDKTKDALLAWQTDATHTVTGHVGTGVILIKRKVFEELKGPWFQSVQDWKCRDCEKKDIPSPDCQKCGGTGDDFSHCNVRQGEDTFFCRRAIDAGYKCFLAAGVIVGHLGEQSFTIEDSFRVNHPVAEARARLLQYEEFQKQMKERQASEIVIPTGPSFVK